MMKRRRYLLFSIIAIVCISAGCEKLFTPTYSKEHIAEDIRGLAQDEYKIDELIDITLHEKTLGVRLHLKEFVTLDKKEQSDVFDDKVIPLFKILRRIDFSSDADFDFFAIHIMDDAAATSLVFSFYENDLRKFATGWISLEDYSNTRMLQDVHLDTLRWGQKQVNRFLQTLQSGNIVSFLTSYAHLTENAQELPRNINKVILDMGKKQFSKWYIVSQNSIQVDEQQRLFFVSAKEFYAPKKSYETLMSYPSGTIHEFFILIAIEDMSPHIKAVYSQESLPEPFTSLGTPQTWQDEKFYVKNYTFEDFFSKQLTRNIMSEFIKRREKGSDDILFQKPNFTLTSSLIIKGPLIKEANITTQSSNVLKITVKPKNETIDKALKNQIIETCLEKIKTICNNYKFYDIGEILLERNDGTALYSITKETLFQPDFSIKESLPSPDLIN